MKLKDLLLSIIFNYKERFDNYPSKTKLLKLAYLTDVLHMRRFRRQLSDATWIYYLYGPYVKSYDRILGDGQFDLVEADISEEQKATIVCPAGEFEQLPDFEEKRTISSVIYDYGGLDLNDLLNHVYFDTEPMINANKRMEVLDFGTVQSQEFYKIRELKIDPKIERDIRKAFRERLRKIRGKGAV